MHCRETGFEKLHEILKSATKISRKTQTQSTTASGMKITCSRPSGSLITERVKTCLNLNKHPFFFIFFTDRSGE